MNGVTCWINGTPGERVSVQNRALQYGDGLFETLRICDGRAQFLGRHLARLRAGCERLRLGAIDWPGLETQLQQYSEGIDSGVLKVMLVRAQGARGYGFDVNAPVETIICLYPPASAQVNENRQQTGVRTRICSTRLAEQPLLAGIKHLNRLEQVLARGEWTDGEIAEGLMLDNHEHVIEGTMSNLFAVSDGQLLTPELSACGVSGILRSVVLDNAGKLGMDTKIRTLALKDLRSADELFVCNSVIGIWPVIEVLELGQFDSGPVTGKLQSMIAGHDDGSENWYP